MAEGGGELPRPEEAGKDLSRRKFLKILTVGAAGAVAGSKLFGSVTKTSTSGEGMVEKHNSESLITSKKEIVGNDVLISWEDGMPKKWEDKISGRKGEFDLSELRKSRERASKMGNDLVAAAIWMSWKSDELEKSKEYVGDAEKLEIDNKVSTEELETRGVEVVASPEGVSVGLMASAFEDGGLLEAYKKGGSRRLVIAVVESLVLTQEALKDDRYDSFLELVDKQLFVATRPQALVRRGDAYNNELNAKLVDSVPMEELISQGLAKGVSGLALNADNEANEGVDLVLLAVSKKSGMSKCRNLVVQAKADGSFRIDVVEKKLEEFLEKVPKRYWLEGDENFTDPDTYTEIPGRDRGSLEWKLLAGVEPPTKDPAFLLIHELVHIKNYNIIRDKHEVDNKHLYSETETDLEAKKLLKTAYANKLEKNDLSGYQAFFQDVKEGSVWIG